MSLNREYFGPGRAGDIAFEIVASGTKCGECEKPAKGTTDVDVIGDLTVIPHCSPAHHRKILEQATQELEMQGHPTAPGRNGWGRA